jgi:N-sulfoglucosamine sulfohydrolase
MRQVVSKFLLPLWAFLLTLAPACGWPAEKSARMNVLLMIGGDLGKTVGCYGDRQARTPNMDQLASEGMRFENAWVAQSSCSSSRSSIYTGLFPHQNGQLHLAHVPGSTQMHPGVLTLPALLKGSGYRTGLIGKFHVRPEELFPWDKYVDNQTVGEVRNPANFAREAETFLRECGTTQPFCLTVAFIDPHFPIPDQVAGVPQKPLRPGQVPPMPWVDVHTSAVLERTSRYYNSVTRVDAAMGLVLEKLRQAGRDKDTVVIVIGDNGPPFTRGKTTCYEAGLRTPFLVRWPGRAQSAATSKALISTVDILPTILDLAGVQPPKGLAGASLVPLLEGHEQGWRKTLFGEFTAHVTKDYFPRRAVRDEHYKLIHNLLANERANRVDGVDSCPAFGAALRGEGVTSATQRAFQTYRQPPEFELYDLEKDPNEFTNLAGQPQYASVEQKLKSQLEEWQKKTDDPLLDRQKLRALTERFDKATSEIQAAPKARRAKKH